MAQRVHLIVNIAVAADGAGVGGVAALGAGGLGHDSLVAVALGVHTIINIAVAAGGAGIGGVAALGAGRLGDLSLVSVTQGSNFVSDIGIAAGGTGVGGVARLGTGGCGNRGLVVMALCLDDFGVAVAAGAGIGDEAVFGTSRLHGDGFVMVTQSCDLVSNIRIATGTGIRGVACLGAGGGGHNSIIAVALGRNGLGVGIAAGGAGMGGVACLGAGGLGDHGLVVMANGGDLFFFLLVAVDTASDLHAILFTGGFRNSDPSVPFMLIQAQGAPVQIAAVIQQHVGRPGGVAGGIEGISRNALKHVMIAECGGIAQKCDDAQILAACERRCTDLGNAFINDHIGDLAAAVQPGQIIIDHLTVAGNEQGAFIVQLPDQAVADVVGIAALDFGFEVGLAYGIEGVELGGVVFRITEMIGRVRGEVHLVLQEIIVVTQGLIPDGIPGGVGVVVEVAELDDVPAVAAVIADAGDDTAVDAQFQRQLVQQDSVALADSSTVDHGCIGGVLQLVVIVLQRVVIVDNVFADVVIHGAEPLVVRTIGIHGGQQCIHRLLQFRLLFGGGVVGHGICIGHIADTVPDGSADANTVACINPPQSIALIGVAGVSHRSVENILMLGGYIIGSLVVDHDGLLTIHHGLAHLLTGLCKGGGIHGIRMELRMGLLAGLYQVILGDDVGIQGVDVGICFGLELRHRLQGHGMERDHAQGQNQGQQKADRSFHSCSFLSKKYLICLS